MSGGGPIPRNSLSQKLVQGYAKIGIILDESSVIVAKFYKTFDLGCIFGRGPVSNA
jgi:hypothetical protein